MSAAKPIPLPARPGQESVWDYPRPAVAEPAAHTLRVEFAGTVIAETKRGIRTLETSHPPSYYLPPEDVRMDLLIPSSHSSFCEWKGKARYYDVVVGDRQARHAAWSYAAPTPAFAMLRGFIAFYPGHMDACFVDGERVTAQPGGFYGGWVTRHVVGPFKGGPGSQGW